MEEEPAEEGYKVDPLIDFITKNVKQASEGADPVEGAVDLMVLKVMVKDDANKDEFVRLAKEHKGCHNECDPFDGNEHSYIELGGWLGDQGFALCFMAIATKLGLAKLMTPETVMPFLPQDLKRALAGQGYIVIKAHSSEVAPPSCPGV